MGDTKKFKSDDKSRNGSATYSRLFIVCSKAITEDEFRTAFEKFGNIEEIKILKNRNTGEPKGVAYIQFAKTSEAARALEEMNGTCIVPNSRPLKVMIASSRDEGSKRDINEEERLLRLFCVVPKSHTDKELREHFEQFGDLDYVSIVKDRETKESKGFAYVKFHKFSHAALAFENCDRMYKAVFAEPKPKPSFGSYDRLSLSQHQLPAFDSPAPSFIAQTSALPLQESSKTLHIIASPSLNQDQLWKLFDLVPGLDYLHLDSKSRTGKGQAVAVYKNPSAAVYAKEKLHGFEYPLGERLIVKPDVPVQPDLPLNPRRLPSPGMRDAYPSSPGSRLPVLNSPVARIPNNLNSSLSPARPTTAAVTGSLPTADLAALAETIAQATSLIQAAGLSPRVGGAGLPPNSQPQEMYDPTYCSVKLPPPQPLAPVDAETAVRLFIVCQPAPPAPYVLRDVFGRFGNLIDVYILNNKNCGYAKYSVKESADQAVQTLHGQEVCGNRLKVMEAEPRQEDRRKRLRYDDQ